MLPYNRKSSAPCHSAQQDIIDIALLNVTQNECVTEHISLRLIIHSANISISSKLAGVSLCFVTYSAF